MDYATRLKNVAEKVKDTMFIVMRVYFEKPRTTVGWKGLINDPHMDDSFDIEAGLKLARKILIQINELGLPAGTEALDPISPQYLGDLVFRHRLHVLDLLRELFLRGVQRIVHRIR